MENNMQVSNNNEAAVEAVATPVQQKEDWKTRAKNFGRKHKKGLIAGALAVVGTIIFCVTRKGDENGDFEQTETMEVETEVEITGE